MFIPNKIYFVAIKIAQYLFYMLLFLFAKQSIAQGNFYIGSGFGLDNTNFNKTLHIQGENKFYYKNDNLHGDGCNLFATIGYQILVRKLLLATEFLWQWNSLKYHGYVNDHYQNNEVSHGDFTIANAYFLSLMLGYEFNTTTIFLTRLGLGKGNFKYWEYKLNANSLRGISERRWLNEIQLGIGLQSLLTRKFALRFEVLKLFYATYLDESFQLARDVKRTIQLRPRGTEAIVTLIYNL